MRNRQAENIVLSVRLTGPKFSFLCIGVRIPFPTAVALGMENVRNV